MPLVVVLSLSIVQILVVAIHVAVLAMLATTFGIGGAAVKWLFLFLAFTFIISSFLSHKFINPFVAFFYAFSAYWFGLVMFLFGGTVAFLIVANISYALGWYTAPHILGAATLGVFAALYLYAAWQAKRAETTYKKIELPHLSGEWRGKKIVFVSDLHLGNVHGAGFAAKVVKKIQAHRPEAVFIGGDLYDGVACDLARAIEPLRALRPPRGVYFVSGNHDYYLSDPAKGFAAIEKAGIHIIKDEKIDLDGLQVVGIDYRTGHEKDSFQKAIDRIGAAHPDEPVIFLKHEPTLLDIPAAAGFHLGFFGHTHHGQLYPLTYFTRRIYKGFDYGLKKLGVMQICTSSGVGTWGPPLRLGTRSEIVCVELV